MPRSTTCSLSATLAVSILLFASSAHAVDFPRGIPKLPPIDIDPGRWVPRESPFRRGDVRADGNVELSDAVTLLRHLYNGTPSILPCGDAADANDDGTVGLSDAVTILTHLFSGGKPLPAPFQGCGADPTADALGCVTFAPCDLMPAPSADELRRELAYHYAPVHYQDASSSGYRYDMITRVDFDGNWDMAHKWEAAANMGSPPAHVYYSVVATPSHWYILYAFYHPRDWASGTFDQEHENDLEGLLLVVFRDGSAHGKLEAAVTAAHTDFYSYTPEGSDFSANAENIDGLLILADGSHPMTFQEAQGHGVYAYGGSHAEDGDGIWYYPSLPYTGVENPTRPELPTPQGGDANPRAYYTLIDIVEPGGMWDRRGDPLTFDRFGSFRGDEGGGCGDGITVECAENSANAPWAWDDGNDGPVFAGELAFDPAHLVSRYFATPTALFREYELNPYAVEIVLEEVLILSNQDGSGDRSDLYFNLYFSDGRGQLQHDGYEDGIVDGDSGAQLSWVLWDPPMQSWIDLSGAMPQNRFYAIKAVGSGIYAPTFRVRVMDWDSDSGDEWLMSPERYFDEQATSGTFTYDFGRSQLKVTMRDAPGAR